MGGRLLCPSAAPSSPSVTGARAPIVAKHLAPFSPRQLASVGDLTVETDRRVRSLLMTPLTRILSVDNYKSPVNMTSFLKIKKKQLRSTF